MPRSFLRTGSAGPANKGDKKSKAPETCPKVLPSLIPTWSDRNHTVGLAGSVADRPDTDYARHLVGLELDATQVVEDASHQRLEGICDAPRYDTYVCSVGVSSFAEADFLTRDFNP